MLQKQTTPTWIAFSIALAVAAIVVVFQFDRAFYDIEPMSVDAGLSTEEYFALYDKYRTEYSIWTLDENRRHFDWNLRSTKYIFWVSIFISVSGIAFAFWQFAQANQFDRARSERDEVEFKSEMASLSFKTRSVASMVLFVSLIYLMIYVAFLYPIEHAPNALEAQVPEPLEAVQPGDPPDWLSAGGASSGAEPEQDQGNASY